MELHYLFQNINSLATTQVKTGNGVLKSITINKTGGSATTISVYDATTGTDNPIAIIDGVSGPITLEYNLCFENGLRIITATGSAADITVTYE